MIRSIVAAALLLGAVTNAAAKDYDLTPQRLAPGVYFFEGVNQDFSFANGGNIVNVGVIVTDAGVLVINTGPSKRYGEQLRAAIAELSDKPILKVFISKLHPDHFLGNQAFQDVPIAALPATIEGIKLQGEQFTDNMYRLVGHWMRGTEIVLPTEAVSPGRQTVGGRDIELIGLAGHTAGDLIVFDRTSGVLFAGGVVFHDRAPTTPHADLDAWLTSLDRLAQLDYRVIVPSHGPPAKDQAPVAQTRDYIGWLQQTFTTAAESGVAAAELLTVIIPERFRPLAVLPAEYHRSISHLYPRYEAAALPQVAGPAD